MREAVVGYSWSDGVQQRRFSSKCDDNYSPPLCSDFYHSQEQSPGYPTGDGNCAAPGCDCGSTPCGLYVFNHSSDAVVKGQTFQQWFVHSYMLNSVGSSPLVSGFFWDDVWNPQCNIHDQVKDTCKDMGLTQADLNQLTDDYLENMSALRNATLAMGKFAWQMLWTGGATDNVGGTCPEPLVKQASCASDLRSLCNASSGAQTRAMMYAFGPGGCNSTSIALPDFDQDLANFLLTRGPYSYLGHGWMGCSHDYIFPDALNKDYGVPSGLCEETSPGSGVFTRDYSHATVTMDCSSWTGTISMKP